MSKTKSMPYKFENVQIILPTAMFVTMTSVPQHPYLTPAKQNIAQDALAAICILQDWLEQKG